MDRNSAGFVYLRFENSQSAMEAQRALNGRWFAGKMIGATFMVNLWLLSLPHLLEPRFEISMFVKSQFYDKNNVDVD